MDEELFRFVAVRDAQRIPQPKTLKALSWAPTTPSALVVTLRAVSPDRAQMIATAQAYQGSFQFVGSADTAPEVIRLVDSMLLAETEPSAVVQSMDSALRALTGAAPEVTVGDLLAHPEVRGVREQCLDSYLAAVFGTAASEVQRAWLDRVVKLWALMDVLVERPTMTRDEMSDLLLHALVVLPDGVRIDAEQAAGQQLTAFLAPRSMSASADLTPETLKRYTDLREAWIAVRHAMIDVLPTLAVADQSKDIANLNSSVLSGKVDPTSDAILVGEGILFSQTRLVELPTVVAARANVALAKHLAAVASSPAAARRTAVAAEMRRRSGVDLAPPVRPENKPGTLEGAGRLGIGRLTKAPVIGDLKVVRQRLAGYELGEIAHVENLLSKEQLARQHEVIDVAESEQSSLNVDEESHVHDLQTTTRSDPDPRVVGG